MVNTYTVVQLSEVTEYLQEIDTAARAAIMADIATMRTGCFEEVDTKQLDGHIRELRSGPHRISYFAHKQTLYVIQAWRKKTNKTPRKYIRYAKQISQTITAHEERKKNKTK